MSTAAERAVRRTADRAHRVLIEDLARICEDAGITPAALARAANIDSGFLARILAGAVRPSLDTYARLTTALGADLSTHAYPNTGPAIRDRHQARILEALLAGLHPRWRAFTEVAVRRPSRGWIDAVLHEQRERLLLASEIQSELRRIEQLVRWSGDKAASLPSWDGWARLGDEHAVSQLLIIRRTRGTRAAAAEFERQLRLSYPAHPDDALASLTGTAPWPGPAMIWAVIDGARVRLVPGR
ncbi:MAG: helix-turn-helix transcriptional regulator [Chloroflexota bacterium]